MRRIGTCRARNDWVVQFPGVVPLYFKIYVKHVYNKLVHLDFSAPGRATITAGRSDPVIPPGDWGWEGPFVGEKGDSWVIKWRGLEATIRIERVYKLSTRLSIDAPHARYIWDTGQWVGLMMLE